MMCFWATKTGPVMLRSETEKLEKLKKFDFYLRSLIHDFTLQKLP